MRSAIDPRGFCTVAAIATLALSAAAAVVGSGPVVILTTLGSAAILVVLLGHRLGFGLDAVEWRTTGFALVVAASALLGTQDVPGKSLFPSTSLVVAIAVTAATIAVVSARSRETVRAR